MAIQWDRTKGVCSYCSERIKYLGGMETVVLPVIDKDSKCVKGKEERSF